MKAKLSAKAFDLIREVVHEWKPISWAGYDGDEPDLDPSDPDYEVAKSMIVDELDSTIRSIVKQLPRVKTENDMIHLLNRAFSELDCRTCSIECKVNGIKLYKLLTESNVIN